MSNDTISTIRNWRSIRILGSYLNQLSQYVHEHYECAHIWQERERETAKKWKREREELTECGAYVWTFLFTVCNRAIANKKKVLNKNDCVFLLRSLISSYVRASQKFSEAKEKDKRININTHNIAISRKRKKWEKNNCEKQRHILVYHKCQKCACFSCMVVTY